MNRVWVSVCVVRDSCEICQWLTEYNLHILLLGERRLIRRGKTHPVRRSCGVEGGVQGELASLREWPREAHWRFFTACSRFRVDLLRLGLIVCNEVKLQMLWPTNQRLISKVTLTLKQGPRSSRKSMLRKRSQRTRSSTEGQTPLGGSKIRPNISRICKKDYIVWVKFFVAPHLMFLSICNTIMLAKKLYITCFLVWKIKRK